MPFRPKLLAVTALAGSAVVAGAGAPASAQTSSETGNVEALSRHHGDLHDLLTRLGQVHGVLLGELAREGEAVRERGDTLPTAGFDDATVERLIDALRDDGRADRLARGAAEGYRALGPRASEVLRRGQSFQHEVLSILSDPEVADRSAALDAALARYRSRPDVALPAVPKDMDVLYGHPHALAFRTHYPQLDGLVWSGHWLRLAATEPLTDLTAGPERQAGIDTVTARFHAKLSFGEPPQAFPSELPLAPAIAPGFIWYSPESAMVWDNLSMLMEVLGDILASPETTDVEASLEATLDFFLDPEQAVTDRDEWEIMALRHGIFFQGGFPLAVMTENERNAGMHAAHLAGGAPLMVIPGMPRR